MASDVPSKPVKASVMGGRYKSSSGCRPPTTLAPLPYQPSTSEPVWVIARTAGSHRGRAGSWTSFHRRLWEPPLGAIGACHSDVNALDSSSLQAEPACLQACRARRHGVAL